MFQFRATALTWASSIWVERAILAGLLATLILMGLGSAWDAQWHATVGRDSFWIPPHVLIYLGATLAGALSLAVTARAGAEARSTSPVAIFGPLRRQGYAVVLAGAATMLLAAALDEAWHRTLGDFTIWSPPHVLGVAGGMIIGLGTIAALVQGGQRRVLPAAWIGTVMGFVLGSLTVAAYFGVVPAAAMAFLPETVSFRVFTIRTPYFIAVVGALTVPGVLPAAWRLLGRWGVRIVAMGAVIQWAIQEAFHLLATPWAASQFGFAVRQAPGSLVLFHLVVLGFVLAPALAVEGTRIRRPWIVGLVMGGLYLAEVVVGLLWLGLYRAPSLPTLVAIPVLGGISAALGDSAGRRLRGMMEAGAG